MRLIDFMFAVFVAILRLHENCIRLFVDTENKNMKNQIIGKITKMVKDGESGRRLLELTYKARQNQTIIQYTHIQTNNQTTKVPFLP